MLKVNSIRKISNSQNKRTVLLSFYETIVRVTLIKIKYYKVKRIKIKKEGSGNRMKRPSPNVIRLDRID
jgi:hypothetical protein